MFYLTLIIIISISYVIWSLVYYVREYLIKFKASDNGFLNVAAIGSSAVSMLTAVFSALSANAANNCYDVLNNPTLYDADYLEMTRQQLPSLVQGTHVNFAVAVVFFVIYALIRKVVSNEIKNKLEKPKKKWNWGKIV